MMIELTSRTSGASETPSSTSRSSESSSTTSSSSSADCVSMTSLVRARRSSSTMMSSRRRDVELDRVLGGQAQLVDAVDVLGIGDRDAQLVAGEREGDGDDALQHAQLDEYRGVRRDPRLGEVDHGQVVPARDRPRDALRLGVPVVEQRLRERAAAGASRARPRAGPPEADSVAASRSATSSAIVFTPARRPAAGGLRRRLRSLARERHGPQEGLRIEAHVVALLRFRPSGAPEG